MEHAWSKTVVVLFWIATMSWLMVKWVLPPLAPGEPPTVNSIYGSLDPDAPPVCWSVSVGDKPVGWAMIRSVRPASGMLEINSHVHFTGLPRKALAKDVKSLLLDATASLGPIDARNRVEIDPLHRLKKFHSSIQSSKLPQTITIDGMVEGSRMRVHIDLADHLRFPIKYLPTDALVVDQFSPQASLPGLRKGQAWTEPVYNPLALGGQMEVMQVAVEGTEQRSWNNKAVEAFRVTYRKESGSSSDAKDYCGKMWVLPDGTVIRQELLLSSLWLVFDRLAPDDTSNFPRGLAEALRHFGTGSHGGDEPAMPYHVGRPPYPRPAESK